MNRISLPLLCTLLLGGAGCLDEQLPEKDLTGTLRVPMEQVDDPQDLGVAFVGLYSGFDIATLGYPYPHTGPATGQGVVGDAFPYGGTSVGRYAYACYQALKCEVVTGRFGNLEQMIDHFGLTDPEGERLSAEAMFDDCRYYYGTLEASELFFLGDERLDFREEDGSWVADWKIWHTVPREGAVLWGFLDNDFTSCDPDSGSINRRPDAYLFREGTNFSDVLNLPDKYLSQGDFITTEPPTITDTTVLDGYDLVLDWVR